MGVKIGSTSGYLWLDSWIMSNIIQLGTLSFCRRFLNVHLDPGGRQFDQMTQAARSGQANIAEGASRHQTSIETEMKLTDVARASISELSADFMLYLMSCGRYAWPNEDENAVAVRAIKLDKPEYSSDLMHDVTMHILRQKSHFDKWLESDDPIVVANAMLILCGRLNSMLTAQLEKRLTDFKETGGFTENMTAERLETRKQMSVSNDGPACPKCGKPMIVRTAKRGVNSGNQFWSCSDYPRCTGTRNKLD